MKFLFALVGVALAAYSTQPQASPLSPETEYRFKYEGSLISGLPMPTSDSALTRFRSEVVIQQTGERIGRLQLLKLELAADESVETSQEVVPMEKLQRRDLQKEHERLLSLPIRFHYKNGMVSELQFSEEDQPWSKNIKRAVVNMIQVNLNKASADENSWENGFFTVTEKTVEGECEMAYTIVNENKKTLVTKTVNFEKCEKRPQFAYNQRFVAECPECDYNMIVPETIYNYKFKEQQLEEVEVRSIYTVSLKNQPLMKTESRARLTLLETSEIRREIETPKGDREDLIYSSEWEESMEKFFKLGDEAEEKPFEKVPEKVEQLKEIVSRIAELRENQPETAHMFTRLVRHLRMCSEKEIRRFHEEVYSRQEQKEKSIIEHALAVAGTKNTIQHLFRHAEQLTPIKMAQLLKSIQETPYPSEKIAKLVEELAKSSLARQEPVIRQSAWLAYGAIVRGVVVPTQERYVYWPEKELKQTFLAVMREQWEQADSVYEKVLALKTIANSGIDTSVHLLEKIIMEKKQPTIVRREAIDALRLLVDQMPRKIQKVLMPIHLNRLEKNELRMAALHQLVQAKPELPELTQIAHRMEREPNQHVAAFTYHVLTSLAESTLPVHRNISGLCSTLVKNSFYRPEARLLSIYKRLPLFHEESFSGMSLNFGSLIGKDSVIPKDIMASIETVFGGNWNKYLAQVGFSHQNVEALFNKIISKLDKEEKRSSSRASRLSVAVSGLKDLARKLNIRVRESTSEESYAMVYLRYKQMDYAVLPLDDQLLDEIIEKYLRNGAVDMKMIEKMFNIPEFDFAHAGFLFESIMKMPTTVGMPLTISVKMPTVFSANGKIEMEKISYGFRFNIKSQPTAVSTHLHVMSVWCPIFEHGVKIVRSAQLVAPLDADLEVVLKKDIEIQLRTRMPEMKKTLLRVDSRPIGYIRFYEKKDQYTEAEEKTIEIPRLERLNREYTKRTEVQGLELTYNCNNYNLWNMETVFLGQQQIEVTVIPTHRMPKELITKLVIEELTQGRVQEPKVERMLEQMDVAEGEWESSSKSARREHINKIVREMNFNSINKRRVVLSVRGNEKSEASIRAEWEENFHFVRLVLDTKFDERRDWNIQSTVEYLRPRTVRSVEELKQQKHREVMIHCETKWGVEEKNTVEIIAQLEQSKEQRNLVNEPKTLRGVPAHEHLTRLARLNQLAARVNFNVSPQNEKRFQELFNLFNGYTYWSSSMEREENERNQVRVHFVSEPFMAGFYNMSIQTPQGTIRQMNVRLPILPAYVMPTIVRQPKNVLRHSNFEKTECKVEESRVQTFDNAVFRAPLSTCYTVVAKDCSEEPRYAVLVKNMKKNGEEKKMMIKYETTEIEMEFVQGEPKIQINGKQVRHDSELEENNIEKIGELCVIDLGELVVRFDGFTVKVLLNNGEMNTQCGLCGHFDGEKKNDYRTAANEETDDLEEFHRSYIVKTEECSSETSEKKMYREYSEESSSEEDNEWSNKNKKQWKQERKVQRNSEESEQTTEPENRVIIQEFPHRLCFSFEKIPTCPKGTNGRVAEKKIRFGCLPKTEIKARKMVTEIRSGRNVDTSDLQVSFVDNQLVPSTCIVV